MADLHRAGGLAGLVGQVGQQGHPGEHAVPGLLEVHRPGVVVHVHGDLVHPGQGVHHQQVFPRPAQLGPREDVDALVALVFQGIDKPLPLDAGHVQHVQLRDHRLQAGHLDKGHLPLPHELTQVLRHRQVPGGDEEEADILKFGQRLDEGVDRPAVFQIAAQPHAQPVHRPPQAGDGG